MPQIITRGAPLRLIAVLALLLLAPFASGATGLAGSPAPAVAAGLPTDRVPDPHQSGVLYFAATGHTLRGAFLTYWNRYGGLAQFGYPITEEFAEGNNGPTDQKPFMVQYFQRARFEHHPENAGTQYEVELGLLGPAFHTPDPPAPAMANPSTMYFTATGHNLSGPFKAYWQAHGGLFVNGNPISEAFQEVNPIDGKSYSVQYFERERFEYHSENAGTPFEVELGLLGTQMARQKGYFGGSGYPLYGHAADFSWIAGQIVKTKIQGGCTYFQYSATGDRFVPVGDIWAAAQGTALGQQGVNLVAFGHEAASTEPVPVCGAKGYVIDRLMPNTGP